VNDIHSFEPIWPGWIVDTEIGHGTYGTVWTAHRMQSFNSTVQRAAVKHITVPTEGTRDDLTGFSSTSLRNYYAGQLRHVAREIDAMVTLRGKQHIVAYEEHRIIPKPEGLGFDLFLRMELLTSLP